MRTSSGPMTVMTANGEVRLNRVATVYVKQRTYSSQVCFFKRLSQCLSVEKLCQEHGYTYHWARGENPHLIKKTAREWTFSIYPTVYHLWFLEYHRVLLPLRPHLLPHHLHHRILYLTKADSRKIQYKKEVEVRVKRFGETRCMMPQKPKTQIKMVGNQKYKEIFRITCLIGYRNSGRIWSMTVLQQSLGETQSRKVQTLPVRLMIFQWSHEHTWNKVRVSTVYLRTFRRTKIVKYA